MDIVSRAQWGAKPWVNIVYAVPLSTRTEFLVHYHGGVPPVSIGPGVPRDCEAIHLANGWAGIGYNFVVDQDGTAYEGRGWSLVGAHCPNHNRTGLGVYVAVGADQEPSEAALATVRSIYDDACRLTGRALRKTWHGANYPTECPGAHLITWIEDGMPMPAPVLPEEDMALSNEDVDKIVNRILGANDALYEVHDQDKLLTITDALSEILKLLRSRP